MMERFENSWELIKISFSVLMQNKKLLVFPIVTFICTGGIFLFFASAIALQPTGHAITEKAHWQTVGTQFFTVKAATPQSKETIEPNPQGIGLFALIYAFILKRKPDPFQQERFLQP